MESTLDKFKKLREICGDEIANVSLEEVEECCSVSAHLTSLQQRSFDVVEGRNS